MALEVITNDKMVCPFRTKTVLVPNQYNAADSVTEYPECQYALCPFYDSTGVDNLERCRRILLSYELG